MISRQDGGALAPPETDWRAGLLQATVGLVTAIALAQALAAPLLGLDPADLRLRLWLTGLVLALELAVWQALRRGRPNLAIGLQLVGGWAALGFALSLFGGAGSPGLGGYVLLAAMAALLCHPEESRAYAALSAATMLAMAWAETSFPGYPLLPAADPRPSRVWLNAILLAILAGLMFRLALRIRQTLLQQASDLEVLSAERDRLQSEAGRQASEIESVSRRLREELEDRTAALASLQASAGSHSQAQRRLDAILAHLPQVLLYEQRNGESAIVGNVEGLLGYPAEAFGAGHTSFVNLVHPEDGERVRGAFERWSNEGRQGVLSQEFRCRRADGSYIWLQDYAVTMQREDGRSDLAGVLIDISDRRRAEDERERFTQQLRTAAETAERLGAILDPERLLHETVQVMQDRFALYHVHCYLFDRERKQLVVRAGSGEAGRRMVEAGHSIPLQAERSIVARAARQQSLVLVEDVQGDPRFLPNPLLPATRSEVAIPLVGRDGVIGVLDVQDDRPDRFGASDLDTFSTLAGQIGVAIENARVFDEMQSVMERLREVDRLKSEFLANMSHELRTPLNSIIGYAELILMGINGELEAETRKDLQAIFDNGQQLLTLINDLLDLAKIEAGRMRLEAESVLVGPLLEEVRTRNAGLLLKKPIEMGIDVAPDLPAIQVDRLRIEQVLGNLVSNAVKFTEEGHIWLRAYRDGEEICLEVEDSGIGIDDEGLATIFDKFRQADGSFTRRAKGTGLGLAITRHLVDMHGGRIDVRSQVDSGTIFTVRLPLENRMTVGAIDTLFGMDRNGDER